METVSLIYEGLLEIFYIFYVEYIIKVLIFKKCKFVSSNTVWEWNSVRGTESIARVEHPYDTERNCKIIGYSV